MKLLFKEKNLKISMTNGTKLLSSDNPSGEIVIPEDMKPVYKDTGHPEKDKQRYTEAKKQLLIEHPEYNQQ